MKRASSDRGGVSDAKKRSFLCYLHEMESGNEQGLSNKLPCSVCAKFKASIATRRNFSECWISGADSIRNSNVCDHARCDQHLHAMNLLKREQARVINALSSYAPIAHLLSKIPQLEREQLKRKFDIAYFLAKEKLSYRKYPCLCELEARHGVSIGTSYTNEIGGKTFSHNIAESQRQKMLKQLGQAKFFSLLIDGSTDKASVDNEVFMAVWCDINAADKKIHTQATYFHVGRPYTVDAAGLFQSLRHCKS